MLFPFDDGRWFYVGVPEAPCPARGWADEDCAAESSGMAGKLPEDDAEEQWGIFNRKREWKIQKSKFKIQTSWPRLERRSWPVADATVSTF
jgi:hypothetical protein